jgi:subtilisin family serine protease
MRVRKNELAAACIFLLAAVIPYAGGQGIAAPSFGALLHTGRLRQAGYKGQGVRVGMISNGASSYTTLAQQGILPAVAFYGGDRSRGDEGDWMLQIVHRIAPEARLAFCPGGPPGRTVACARDLIQKFHAGIVVDDTNPQPVFEFPTAKEIGYRALTREYPYVLFFTGAGNNGGGYYEGSWTPTPLVIDGVRYQAQDFGRSRGSQSDPYERVDVPPGRGVKILLGTNADPNGQPLCSTGSPEVTLVLLGALDRVLESARTRCPVLTVSDPAPPHGSNPLRLAVLLPEASHPAGFRLKLVTLVLGGQGVSPLPLEYRSGGGAGNSATARNLVSVAAIDPNTGWQQRYLYEAFANAGPQCMDYDHGASRWTRLPAPRCFRQPVFVVPDKMRVVMPGPDEERYVAFSGDSAAGPAAAGVTALLLSAHVPADRVIGLLEKTALPQVDAPGWNAHYGYGLINADAAAVDAGILAPTQDAKAVARDIPLFQPTPAFIDDRRLALQARQGDPSALARLQGAAQAGEENAEAWLAQYEHGIGNETLAAHWAEAAADQGEPTAQSLLGSMYNRGWGVTMDPRAAQAWWWRAARAGVAAAMFNMGTTLAGGRGAPADPELGYALMRAAFLRGMRFPPMLNALSRARLRMHFDQIATAERLASRFASHPAAIPPP